MHKYKKRIKLLLPILFLIFISLPIVFATITFKTTNTIYRTSGGGIIQFDKNFYASRLYFKDGLLYIENFNYGSKTWSKIGFSCDSSTANMTIKSVAENSIKYTVNAPDSIQSTTKVFVNDKGRPKTIDGCASWDYNPASKVVDVKILHHSPEDVTITFISYTQIKQSYFDVISSSGIVLITLVITAIILALNGNLNIEILKALVFVAVLLSLGVAIMSMIL